MDNESKINSLNYGMDLDSLAQYIKEGDLSYALNANIQSNESSQYTYTNELSNVICSYLRPGYNVIGVRFIPELNQTVFALVDGNGNSEFGYIIHNKIADDNLFMEDLSTTTECKDCGGDVIKADHPRLHLKYKENCNYITIINCTCLNFDMNFPVKMVHKVLECGTIIYFVDGKNPDRYINLSKLPYKKIENFGCLPVDSTEIDCNLMNSYPNVKIPCISIDEVMETGSLEWGTYQFSIAYASKTGDALTKFFSVTNPVPIIKLNQFESDFGQASSKSIKLSLSNLDTSYQYYNLYVIKTIRNVSSMELVGTFLSTNSSYVYTGDNKTQVPIPLLELFKDFPYYRSNIIATSNGYLLKGDLKSTPFYNWQKVANKIKLKWQVFQQKYKEVSYKNPLETVNKKTYQRDEVYAFGIVFILKTGERTSVYPLIGREKSADDKVIIPISNLDNLNTHEDCIGNSNTDKEKWQVYNTAIVTNIYTPPTIPCESVLVMEGEFAYWESTEKYPCNKEIWGELADTPIRHFKFPDNTITHIHDSPKYSYTHQTDYYAENNIYPIGVAIDEYSLNLGLSLLSAEERDMIEGIEIVRANRVNNKSITAKGLIYNVGMYDRYTVDNKVIDRHFYPNYPFNDIRQDEYLSTTASFYPLQQPGKLKNTNWLDGFHWSESKERFTFHSPDTHFYEPGLGNVLKLETEEYGIAKSKFVEVEKHAKYRFVSVDATAMAANIASFYFSLAAVSVINGTAITGFISTYDSVLNIIKLSIAPSNFVYQQNSVGNYNNYAPKFNDGFKQRRLDIASYLSPDGYNSVGDTHTINNYQRESSVYLKVSGSIPFTTQADTSRYLPYNGTEVDYYDRIASYYASIKRIFPDQYSTITNMDWVSTGFCLNNIKGEVKNIPPIFGGDTFITKFALKRKFRYFNDDRVNFPDDADIAYEFTRNVSNPIYYFNTTPETQSLLNGVAGAPVFKSIINKLARVPKHNLDGYTRRNLMVRGRMYLFNYGIPYFFVESDVNTEYRFSENDKDKDFYPRMSPELDIPEWWLQEKNVSIVYDNSYIYNKDYSKQNKETPYSTLPIDYTNQLCKYVYPNRVAYSDQSLNDEQADKWLIFKANNFYDFPRENGRLKIMKGIDNTKVLCVFENTFSIYNAYVTLQTNMKDAIVGNGGMFATAPIEYTKSEVGYGGTSNSTIITNNFGTFWIDSKRTKVYNFTGQGLIEISDAKYKLERFFNNNLEFVIKDYFPDVYTDNPFKGIGFSFGWDEKNSRLFFTKLDYQPISDRVAYDSTSMNFYDKVTNNPIQFSDPTYFCNKSFTLAYLPALQRWISFYSFHPNYYISYPNYFQTGYLNNGVWSHEISNKFYQTYCNTIYPYILEYVVSNKLNTEITENIEYSQEIKEYYDDNEYYSIPDGSINFNKAIIYNTNQSTGLLNLIKRPINNLNSFISYPKYNLDSKDILYSYYENKFSFNTFWDVTKNFKNRQPIFLDCCTAIMDKELNPFYHDYSTKTHTKNRMRSEFFKVRLIQDFYNRYKFINHFNVSNNLKSN